MPTAMHRRPLVFRRPVSVEEPVCCDGRTRFEVIELKGTRVNFVNIAEAPRWLSWKRAKLSYSFPGFEGIKAPGRL